MILQTLLLLVFGAFLLHEALPEIRRCWGAKDEAGRLVLWGALLFTVMGLCFLFAGACGLWLLLSGVRIDP